MATWIRGASVTGAVVGMLLAALLPLPERATAQCVGASAVEDFAGNMKGCAATVEFASRAATCAPGWHVCSASEYVARYVGKVPTYNYWTNDNLKYDSDDDGCFVSLDVGTDCSPSPMRVCTIARGDYDGAYGTGIGIYTIQTFLPDGVITLVTHVDSATLASRTFVGSFSGPVFTGARLGGPGSLTLTFTSDTNGTDGAAALTKLATQQFFPSTTDFNSVTDPLGNHCNWHSCGFNSGVPNRYMGGCSGNSTAGVLCCQ